MSSFPSIRIEGGLLGPELLDQVIAADVPGQKPADFGLEPKRNLTDEIAAAFADSRALWGVFQNRLARLPEDDLATTVTRDQWVIPFLGLLGYELRYNQRALEVDGQTFAISHAASFAQSSLPSPHSSLPTSSDAPPIHVVGARQELGRVPPSGRPRMAPHSLVQEYLNRTEHVWGIATNGLTLRLLRDSTLVRRQAYIEFDLQAIFEEQRFHDFAALYRLLHRSRLPRGMADANECLLEKYHAQTIEQGGRVREHLRDGVEECLKLLGNGFLSHPDNQALRDALSPPPVSASPLSSLPSPRLTPAQFYRQLLRLVYRFLFLLVSEDRGLISPNPVYRDHYGIARLRRMLDVQAAWTDHPDLWLSLRTLWKLFGDDKLAKILDLAPLNGELFAPQTLDGCTLTNRDLLAAFWHLAYYQERAGAPSRRVNYAALDVEELGSVYESLLEFHPDLAEVRSGERGVGSLHFDLVFGSERKTTGSFYTPPELVNELIESALVPVIEDRLGAVKPQSGEKGVRCAERNSPLPTPFSPLAEQALLSLKIIDVACGSGHMLLAAARRVGKELAKLRTGEDEPAPERVRESIRDVISHCIYGVDRNPLAVDLCRVALWLESHTAGKPLTFLDHRIRCGDSLVGVFDLGVLAQGIPDKAFDPCEGDDKPTARAAARQNREERRGAQDLFALRDSGEAEMLTRHSRDVDAIPDDAPELIRRKKELFEASHRDPAWLREKQACDLWTAAFFQNFVAADVRRLTSASGESQEKIQSLLTSAATITSGALADHLGGRPIDARLHARAGTLALRQPFFHWPLEFPEVFSPRPSDGRGAGSEGSGFDVVLSNPPWERIKLQEQEFFAARDPRIATAANKATRSRLITELIQKNPVLHAEFIAAVHDADCVSKFLRQSNRFPLTAVGDINTYAIFAENISHLLNKSGQAGIIVPTGVATDNTTKDFFGNLIQKQRLIQLTGFENEEFIFPAIHHSTKFCALTVSGEQGKARSGDFVFLCRNFKEIREHSRHFRLSRQDFALLNPNTQTCPVFRTNADAELTKKIYGRAPVFINETTGENPWKVNLWRMTDMSGDSELFKLKGGDSLLPLYEAKMVWQFDHRYATYDGATQANLNSGILPQAPPERKQDPHFQIASRYWLSELETLHRLVPLSGAQREEIEALPEEERITELRKRSPRWLVAYRRITSIVVERTMIACLLPRVALSDGLPLFVGLNDARLASGLQANFNSLCFDYVARQKIGGTHMDFHYLKQIPVFPPTAYTPAAMDFIAPRVLELDYTAWELQPFAEDMGYHGDPFRWDEARRALLRAELDAWFARAYGLTRDELRYILDPADVYGPDFPGETFRVLKEKETAKFGEYRTRRLVLEAWDKLT